MKNDLNLTFGEIFHGNLADLKVQLQDIQRFRRARDESEEWVQNLRFLDVSNVPDLESLPEERSSKRQQLSDGRANHRQLRRKHVILPIVTRGLKQEPYVAVSWKWLARDSVLPFHYSTKTKFDYKVRRPGPGERPQACRFPSHYLERVIRYCQHISITNIWVDTESIYQRSNDDKKDIELGTEIMDVVYTHSSRSLALLTTPLTDQVEIRRLDELLSRTCFIDANEREKPELKPTTNRDAMRDLILKILSDVRWSRGWIFQEDHLSSDRMVLLIPHPKHLHKHGKLGDIPGELRVSLYSFKQAATMFCIAMEKDDDQIKQIQSRLKQYNISNRRAYEAKPNSRNPCESSFTFDHPSDSNKRHHFATSPKVYLYPTMTTSLLEDISHRDLEKQRDRIPILANAAKFPTRLDARENSKLVRSQRYSLSTALLALILLNGEMLRFDHHSERGDILHLTLLEYLQQCRFNFKAPGPRFEQSFINHCRFRAPRITACGIETRGHLFMLLPKSDLLRLPHEERSRLERLRKKRGMLTVNARRRLSKFNRHIIEGVIERLRGYYGQNCGLATFLEQYLPTDEGHGVEQDPPTATSYIIDMASAIATAIWDCQDVRLGVLRDTEMLQAQDGQGSPGCTHAQEDANESDNGHSIECSTQTSRDNNEEFQPSAIFIPPAPHDKWNGEYFNERLEGPNKDIFVFASWERGRVKGDGMERLASVEVSLLDGDKTMPGAESFQGNDLGAPMLRNLSWVNGIWHSGRVMNNFTFPLPGIHGS